MVGRVGEQRCHYCQEIQYAAQDNHMILSLLMKWVRDHSLLYGLHENLVHIISNEVLRELEGSAQVQPCIAFLHVQCVIIYMVKHEPMKVG